MFIEGIKVETGVVCVNKWAVLWKFKEYVNCGGIKRCMGYIVCVYLQKQIPF